MKFRPVSLQLCQAEASLRVMPLPVRWPYVQFVQKVRPSNQPSGKKKLREREREGILLLAVASSVMALSYSSNAIKGMWEMTHKCKTHFLQLNWTKLGSKFSCPVLENISCCINSDVKYQSNLNTNKQTALQNSKSYHEITSLSPALPGWEMFTTNGKKKKKRIFHQH